MTEQVFSIIVTALGLLGFELAGRKIWWAWYVNILNQVAWLIFALITGYYAFLVGTAFYFFVFSRNAYKWTKEHFEDQHRETEEALNAMTLADDTAATQGHTYFPCGHMSHQWRLVCTGIAGHKEKHAGWGKVWSDDEGEYNNQFTGRVITPKE